MERRALLAVVISLLILVVYQEVVIKRLYGPPEEVPPKEAPLAEKQAPARAPEVAAPEVREAPAPPEVEPKRVEGRDVVVETDLYRAAFTTAGARLKSFELKRFRTTVQPESPPLELLQQASAHDLPLGIVLRGRDSSSGKEELRQITDSAVDYRVDREALRASGEETSTLTFSAEIDGATIRKQLAVSGNSYMLDVDVSAEGFPSPYSELGVTWDKTVTALPHNGQEVLFDSTLALRANKLHRHAFDDLDEGAMHDGDIQWAGYSGRYFLAALVPTQSEQNDVRLWLKRRQDTIETQVLFPPQQFRTRLTLYLGPKEIDGLEQAGHSLRRAVDLGWFTFAALPLLNVLKLSHRLTGNYGIDIILLTVVIKVLFIPLTQKSLKSMREMQKLQPQMAKIRERFKDKPEEMNKEIMEMYRRHKVNPLGGCLPMVLQIPVFIGLYQALLNAVELRHAPFVGWITDLSAPDRLGSVQLPFVEQPGFPVLTLLMGASMFAQQWMTPSTGDPTQQRIMLIMPVMFTFMFINFPAGLTLYWLVNNILTIAQQYTIYRPEK
jgi:YidC/Oxa1 family membrane protein insertase